MAKTKGISARATKIAELRPHPRNYRHHPDGQLDHIRASIRQHGFYRNVVLARDGTILAGHGVVEAARREGLEEVPALYLDLDPDSPAALKVLAADNELGRFAEDDDRALTELLREIKDVDVEGLLGTGYDEKQLAALLLATRPAAEVPDSNAAAEWVGAGMPEYEEGADPLKIVVTFNNAADRKLFVEKFALAVAKPHGNLKAWAARWPDGTKEDVAAGRFEAAP